MFCSRSLLTAAAVVALGAANLFAADPNHGMAYRFTELKGMNVENSAGENLGEIEDVVYDQNSGKVRYVAVSFGGFLGVGDKLFAVPWGALKHENDTVNGKHRIVMNADKKSLENAPGFDTNAWPNVADPKWSAEVDKFYGDAHGVKADGDPGPGYRLSMINGLDVQNSQNENLGEIKDSVIDVDQAKVRYFAVSFGGFLGVGDKLFAVPYSAVKIQTNAEGKDAHVVMNVDKATLEKAPSFTNDRWPNVADEAWSKENDAHYQAK